MRSPSSITSPLISGITSFLVGSILQHAELSITYVPTSANFGAHSFETPLPAENSAIAGLISIACCGVHTVYSFPLNSTLLPDDLSDATGISSVTGKFLSCNTLNIFLPTRPVAPTTATFIISYMLKMSFNTPPAVCFAPAPAPLITIALG